MESPTNRIKEVLIEKGIKQTWLAEKLGKSFTIVNSYVCNRRQPSLELLFQIAEILQVILHQTICLLLQFHVVIICFFLD